MNKSRYWYTGINVRLHGYSERRSRWEWSVSLSFLDGRMCDNASTEGGLRCRYLQPLGAAVATLKAEADGLGFTAWAPADCLPALYVDHYDLLTDDQMAEVKAVADDIGFRVCLNSSSTETT